MARRIKIGDIIEIKTEKGLVYAQYTHKNSLMGNLIRVFTGFYNERPISFDDIVNGDIRFMTFFPLQAAINQNIVAIVSNTEIPEKVKPFPTFKNGLTDPTTGKITKWWLWDGNNEWDIENPNKEQMKYSYQEIINDTLLIERILSEWRPEHEA